LAGATALRLVFAGTPEFAVPSLAALAGRYDVCCVLTQPDRPAGRGRRLTASPVRRFALEHGMPVEQPASLRKPESRKLLERLAPELMVVVAYGLILPRAVLEIPRLGCLNVHASLLPRWRGAAPIQRAILAGDRETGITIMQMDEGLDTGDILLQASLALDPRATAGDVHDALAMLGAETLVAAIEQLRTGSLVPRHQDPSRVTYAEKLAKSEAGIDWTTDAELLARRVRAFNPWPVAETRMDGQRLRIWEAEALERQTAAPPGAVVAATAAGVDVACGQGVLRLTRMQLPGRRPVTAAEFINAMELAGRCLGP
jgi:methionyl-tRNA formyltransferase